MWRASVFAAAVGFAVVQLPCPGAARSDAGQASATSSGGRGSQGSGKRVEADKPPIADAILNKESTRLFLDSGYLKLSGGRLDLTVERSERELKVSAYGTGLSLGGQGEGIISRNGDRVLVRKDGGSASIIGQGVRVEIHGDVCRIRDDDGLVITIEHGRVSASDPHRLTMTGGGPA